MRTIKIALACITLAVVISVLPLKTVRAECMDCRYPQGCELPCHKCVQCVFANYVQGGLGGSDCLAVCGSRQNYCILYCCCDPIKPGPDPNGAVGAEGLKQGLNWKGEKLAPFPGFQTTVIERAKDVDDRLMLALAKIGEQPEKFSAGHVVFAFGEPDGKTITKYHIDSLDTTDGVTKIRVTVARDDADRGFRAAKIILAADGALKKLRVID